MLCRWLCIVRAGFRPRIAAAPWPQNVIRPYQFHELPSIVRVVSAMQHILLTGATGLVGRYLLRDLLARDAAVVVLARSRRNLPSAQRIEAILADWERQDGCDYPRPVVLEANLRQPGCGVSDDHRDWLRQRCDRVLHCAASMTFRADKRGEPHATNAEGMKHLLQLCGQTGIREFHHVSTAYICGLREGRIFENETDVGQQNGNVYEVSKLTAEKLLGAADFLDSKTIYRPASVVGDSRTGFTTSSHGFYLPLHLAYTMADRLPAELMGEQFLALLGLRGDEGKNLVPVDWLAAAIVHLVLHPEHHRRTYHLTHPQPVSVRLIQEVIRDAIRRYCPQPKAAAAAAGDLSGYEVLFKEYMEVYRSHWRDDPIFDRSNAAAALAHLPCPEMNYDRMLRVASYPVERRFVLNGEQPTDSVPAAASAFAPGPRPGGGAASIPSPAEIAALRAPPVDPWHEPIAIIGMACRLPGAANLDEYWRLLETGGSAVVEIPPERFDQRLYYDPRKGVRGKAYSKLAALLADRRFDRSKCPIPASLEAAVDNAHLLMCGAAAEACRHAGLDPFNLPDRNTGVYIGHAQGSDLPGDLTFGDCIEEAAEFLREVPEFQQLPAADQDALVRELVAAAREGLPERTADSPDSSIGMVAGTVAKAFGLNGPYVALNSACASSLQAIQLAARALQAGRIDMAIAGGASDCKQGSMVLFSNAQTLSATGTCPFDDAADGLIISEGYVAVVLKTLRRALADGDPIQAVIRGIGCSSDGKGKSLWAPRKEGQIKAMERAYFKDLDIGSLQFIEAHATSTSLGDATELSALSDVLAGKLPPHTKVAVSSVKANIGHALEAAGIAGLIKTVMCMQHRQIVPAINIRALNSKIEWDGAPIYVPLQKQAWPEPPSGQPRRAAVNAFGIGGLNMHVVVEEFSEPRRTQWIERFKNETAAAAAADSPADARAIAVIGRGCILPGAADVNRFWELLQSGRDPKTIAPPGRWPARAANDGHGDSNGQPRTTLGGYITDFVYDWQRHKVPPKQVQQADPLQFMLLDAAEQALRDAGYEQKPFDRTRTAVLVGTESGGDFGAQLCVSLRLPQLEDILKRQLAARGAGGALAAKIAAGFSARLLEHWPALVDESGSFSTSTLASRITKTMNLMGGAAAIDCGEASSAVALAIAVDLLAAGDCDLLICAGGQRCMNMPKYKALQMAGALSQSDQPLSPFDAAADGIVPGEGVAVVLLKRLADARRDGDRVQSVIRGVGLAHATDVEHAWSLAIGRAVADAAVDPVDVALIEADGAGRREIDEPHVRAIAAAYGESPRQAPIALSTVAGQIGHTLGASAMASLIAATYKVEHGVTPATFGLREPLACLVEQSKIIKLVTNATQLGATADGQRFAAINSFSKGLASHIILERGEKVSMQESTKNFDLRDATIAARAPAAIHNPAPASDFTITRFGAESLVHLLARMQAISANPAAAFANARNSRFSAVDKVRLAIIANGSERFTERVRSFVQLASTNSQSIESLAVALQRQGCVLCEPPSQPPRVAFLFPGQGSQYAGMLKQVVYDVPAAAAMLAPLDEILVRHGYPDFGQMAWENPEHLGVDVWITQLAMLAADLIMHAALTSFGVKPDLVAGHSLGEFAALTAAGAWGLEGVILALRSRFETIQALPTKGALLAVGAPPEVIEPLLKTLADRAYVANINAPEQTIMGGKRETLEQLAALLKTRRLPAQLLPVPCAYHTPLLAAAGPILRRSLDALVVRPPRTPVLSSVTNRYVVEPADIRDNLAAQLTTPVRYVELIERIVSDDETVLIEVGPQRTLTNLNQQILGQRNNPTAASHSPPHRRSVSFVACDNPKQPGVESLIQVRVLLECMGVAGLDSSQRGSLGQTIVPAQTRPAQRGSIVVIDATEKRRAKMREASVRGNGHAELDAHPWNLPEAPHEAAEPVAEFTNSVAEFAKDSDDDSADRVGIQAQSRYDVPAPADDDKPPANQPNAAELEKFLVNFVVEHTGYPAEAVDLDSDLEGDLGIDSIKKAQLFAELSEYFDVRPAEGMTLDDFPTLRHALNFLVAGELKKKQHSFPDESLEPVALAVGMSNGDGQSGAVAVLTAPPMVRSASAEAPQPVAIDEAIALADLELAADEQTRRYVMRMRPAPLPKTAPDMPQLSGAALIVGANAAADALAERLQASGATVHRLTRLDPLDAAVAEVDRLWRLGPIPHLFLMTDRDPQAFDIRDERAWGERRYRTAEAPLFICQRWIQLAGEANLLPKCTLAAATALGGDFGFESKLNSPTGGALAGLAKGVYIEIVYLRNNRSMMSKAIDFPDDEPPDRLAACMCRELAGKSVDFEVGYVGGKRYLPCAYPEPVAWDSSPCTPQSTGRMPVPRTIRPGGNWVFTGGASGITAQCALELGRRFKLKLHLIGRSQLPTIPAAWRDLADDELKVLRTSIMREARQSGRNMDEAWSRVEHDLEIDRWLRQFADAELEYKYHACDVADARALAEVLDAVRRQSGPIEGIVHGAGVERACRFERKQRDSVQATIASKVDGAANLMRLTWDDPVRHFAGFGSISGRMGSNGQVDYCVASDLLCKLTVWYGAARPEVRAIGFHWHSWGEIGMAAKPEATKAIKNFDGPDLMPKREGVRHFLRELLGDDHEREALITSPEFCRRYYRPEELPPTDEDAAELQGAMPTAQRGNDDRQTCPRKAVGMAPNREANQEQDPGSSWPPWSLEPVAARHRLATVSAPLPASAPLSPRFVGPIWIMGDNPLADALRKRLQLMGATVETLPIGGSPEDAVAAVERMFYATPPAYLFLLTARDDEPAALLDAEGWRRRRARGVMTPLLAVQHLMRLRRRQPDRRPINIVAVTGMGGDFGLSGKLSSPEGGVLCGLMKSLYIEDSRREQSEGKFKAIDAQLDEPPELLVDAILREMAANDPHIEVGWSRGRRVLVRAVVEPAESLPRKSELPSGTWVVTGGARGITAAAARELSKRYGVKLHLIGRSPAPPADAPWLGASTERLAEIRAQIVRDALAAGRPIETDWARVRTDIEIDQTLKQFAAEGIQATYHACDLSDWPQLAQILEQIRQTDGPIEGVLHGAGYGKSGRFDTRPLDSIERTLAGKLDGAVAMMALTRSDPVKYWIGFGSLSGRFGGNGLADYAAANDMLAKLVDWYRAERPQCAACCFHWQSWNEIGMAMLGDSAAGTKNILKMNFLAPQEGLEHFCRELEAGLPRGEVLITDGFFERTFYPFVKHDTRVSRTSFGTEAAKPQATSARPMVASHRTTDDGTGVVAEMEFDPAADPFLLDHKLRDRPFLPAVAALEAIAEAATLAAGKPVTALGDVQFVNGLRFNNRNVQARVIAILQADGSLECRLLSTVAGSSGATANQDRLHVRSIANTASAAWPALAIPQPGPAADWRPFRYPTDSPLLHGPTLQSLLAVAFDPDNKCGWGRASALSLAALGGEKRGLDWLVPATLVDAGFYVCGVYVWYCVEAAVALPAGIGALRFGRLPRNNEPCLIHFAYRGLESGIATFDFTVEGDDGAAVAQVEGYRCQLLGAQR